jgi:hypothetical protein
MKITKRLRALRVWVHNWNELRSIRELTLRAYIDSEVGPIKCVRYRGIGMPMDERPDCTCSLDWSRTECGWYR